MMMMINDDDDYMMVMVMLQVGGRDGSACLRSVECYDPHTNKWTTVASLCKWVVLRKIFTLNNKNIFALSPAQAAGRGGRGRAQRVPVRGGRTRRSGSQQPAAEQVNN